MCLVDVMGGLLSIGYSYADWLLIVLVVVMYWLLYVVCVGLFKGLGILINIYTRTAANSVVISVGGQCGINSFLVL